MGTLCREVFALAGETVAFTVDLRMPEGQSNGYRHIADLPSALPCDCVVDFSSAAGTAELLAVCAARKFPVVIATTGHTDDDRAAMHTAAKTIPVFAARNMSVGVHLCGAICEKLASALQGCDVEILEEHHASKADAPSGTALYFADRVRAGGAGDTFVYDRRVTGKRAKGEIGMHSLRGGSVVGRHKICFFCGGETVYIEHVAEDRELFARGALAAARFLLDKPPALYGMEDLAASMLPI